MATTQSPYAKGGNWFEGLQKSFVDVPIDETPISDKDPKPRNYIETSSFLDAAEGLASLFGTANQRLT